MPAIVINKVPYDFHNTSLDIMVNGESVANIEGVTAIEYTPSVERVKLRGRGRKPLAMTDGELDAEASITVYRYAFDQIVEVARAIGVGICDLEFTLVTSYAHKDTLVRTDTISGCKFASIEQSHSAGTDALVVTLPISVGGEILYDGVPVLA